MCGRFTLRTNASDLVEIFTLLREPELTPPKAGPPLINARADTVATRPSFRPAFKLRRCLASVCVATFCASARK
jgi:putative SOS response-associated peptidase YedK